MSKRNRLVSNVMAALTLVATPGMASAPAQDKDALSSPTAPKVGTWVMSCSENGQEWKWPFVVAAKHGNRYDCFQNATQKDGPLVNAAWSMEYSADTHEVRLDQRLTCTTASTADISGGVQTMKGLASSDGKRLTQLKIMGDSSGLTTTAQWVNESVTIAPKYVAAVVVQSNPLHMLLQQWSGDYGIGDKRYLVGRDYISLESLTQSTDETVSSYSTALLELSAYAGEIECPRAAGSIKRTDGIPNQVYKLVFLGLAVGDDRIDSLKGMVDLLSVGLKQKFKADAEKLAGYIMGQRTTNQLCLAVESRLSASAQAATFKPGQIGVAHTSKAGDVLVRLTNRTGAVIHSCYVRSRVVMDGKLADALEKGYWEDNGVRMAAFQLAGFPMLAGAKADKAMIEFQRLDKCRPYFVSEWPAGSVLELNVQRLDPIARIGKSIDVLVQCDEGRTVCPVSVEEIRAKYGAGIPVGKW